MLPRSGSRRWMRRGRSARQSDGSRRGCGEACSGRSALYVFTTLPTACVSSRSACVSSARRVDYTNRRRKRAENQTARQPRLCGERAMAEHEAEDDVDVPGCDARDEPPEHRARRDGDDREGQSEEQPEYAGREADHIAALQLRQLSVAPENRRTPSTASRDSAAVCASFIASSTRSRSALAAALSAIR